MRCTIFWGDGGRTPVFCPSGLPCLAPGTTGCDAVAEVDAGLSRRGAITPDGPSLAAEDAQFRGSSVRPRAMITAW